MHTQKWGGVGVEGRGGGNESIWFVVQNTLVVEPA